MKAIAQIEKLNSEKCRNTIVRNLSRIMDIRVLDIDLENKTLSFLYESMTAIDKVKKELNRIGYPLNRFVNNPQRDFSY